jgi:hypothetical protein
MSKRFIAYFDYLGFKDFIMNNPIEYQVQYIGHIFRDIENALAKQQLKKASPGLMVPNLQNSKLHCINFSDTVLFYTNDDSLDSLKEILEVADIFNWQCIDFFFPVRGCLYYGECVDRRFNTKTGNTGTYSVNSLIGTGLINAYLKAENQSWAGTVIDDTVVQYIAANFGNPNSILSPHAKMYIVPYKEKPEKQADEWVFNLVKVNGKLNDVAFGNMEKSIIENFGKHNKGTDSPRVKEIIGNTINFLKSYT